MTPEEVKKLLYMINSIYPNFKVENPEQTINIWMEFLGDQNPNAIAASLKAYVRTDTSGFAPSIGKLIQGAYDIKNRDELSAGEAWSMVYRALCNSSYSAAEEFNKLPEVVQRAVGSPDQLRAWALDDHFNESVASSNFRRAYENAKEQKRKEALIPKDVVALIDNLMNPAMIGWKEKE